MHSRRLLRWLMPALLLLSMGARAEPDPPKPQVLVGFEIVAEKFARLPDQATARTDLGKLIAAEFALRYPFSEWSAGSAVTNNPPIGRLTARLVQTPAVPLPDIWVKFFGSTGDNALVELPLPQVPIYSSGEIDRETSNRAAFVAHVAQRVLPVVRSDGFQRRFLETVVQDLSIANTAEMQATERVVVIPRMWRDLRLAQESTLLLVVKKPVGAGVEEGRVRLKLPSQRTRDPRAGWLEASVQGASIGTSDLTLDKGWHTQFQTLLVGAKVSCYIRDYRPLAFPGAVDGVSLVSE